MSMATAGAEVNEPLHDRARFPPRQMFDHYELFAYKQWLRVYMRCRMINHNKDLLECVGDTYALLERLHIY